MPTPKLVKAMTFKEVIADLKKKQEEFEALSPEEQERVIAEQQKAIREFYAAEGTAIGIGVGFAPKPKE